MGGGLAFLFPGQGAQSVGMGRTLADAFPSARAVFEEVDAALSAPLSRLCFEGPAAELTLTANAQPAILAASVAAFRVVEAELGAPAAVAVCGHSLGEWSALVAAGALALDDAARLVRARGRFMQEAVPAGVGAMAALIGLDAEAVGALCAEATAERPGELVQPANFNGGGQVVIAGHAAAVGRACALAKARGARRALPLAVSAPFHCALMAPAAERLAIELDRIEVRAPRWPVVTNVEARPNRDADRVRELLVRQVDSPVRFEECGRQLVALGVDRAVECGPGAVLAGLLKRIAPELRVVSVGEAAQVAAAREVA